MRLHFHTSPPRPGLLEGPAVPRLGEARVRINVDIRIDGSAVEDLIKVIIDNNKISFPLPFIVI